MTVALITPYKPSIFKARILIHEYANIKLSNAYIPALSQELQSLKTSLDNTDRVFNDSLSKVSSTLDVTEIRNYLDILNGSTDESSIAPYNKELKKALEVLKSELETLSRDMKSSLGNFETATISDYSGEISTLEAERTRLLSNLPEDQKKLSNLREQCDVLEKAIIEFKSKTFIDKGMPIFDEIQKAVTEVIDQPSEKSKTAVRAGMNIAKDLLNIANEQLKYNNLVEARDKLAGEIAIWQAQMSYEQKQVDIIDDKKSQLMALSDIAEPRTLYVVEARKIIDMLVALINNVFVNSDLISREGLIAATDKLLENCPAFPNHIDSLGYYWLREAQ
ncbi:alpha-xenorhabdolysin family binary toxin subunit B [Pseudomonas sp. EA_65y_Pfl1_P113]|uniref:alpha-xenorhabdolysin family binary toxin subunit B n=1 Tax=Pseudomonas sp. EA_65y_Pfl1_P113 TaxID=3088692 RepID=UPI0030DA68FE